MKPSTWTRSTRSPRTSPTRTFVAIIAVLALLIPANLAHSAPAPELAAAAQQGSPAAAHVEKAQAALADSKLVDAENELRMAIAADPAYAPIYSWMGQVLMVQPGSEKEALKNAQKAVDMAPKDSRALALLADVQARQDLLAALKTAQQAVQLNPEDPVAQAVLALAYTDEDEWEKAQAAASKAVKLDPKQARGYHALGMVYSFIAERTRARRALEEAVKLEPKNVRWLLTLGDILADSGNEQGARAQYDAVLKIIPDYPPALLDRADLVVGSDKVELSQHEVARAVKAAPNFWRTRLLQGVQATSEGDYKTAEKHFQQALAMSPDNYRIQAARAHAKTNAGECTEAKAILDKLIEARPRLAELHAQLAVAYLCLGDNKKALAEAEKGVELNPYDSLIRGALAGPQQASGRTEEVLASHALAGAAAADPAEFIVLNGVLYLDEDKYAEAEKELALAIKLGATDVETRYRLCLATLSQDKFAEAADACAEAHELDSETPVLNKLYAIALLSSGRPKDAIPLLQSAIDGSNEDAAHRYLALAFMKTRQYKQAQAEYEEYIKLSDEKDERAEQMVAMLKAGWPMTDAAALDELGQIGNSLMDGRLKVKITGKTAKDRRLVLDVAAGAKDTPEQMTERTFTGAGLAALYGARLNPPIAGAAINSLDGKGKPFLTLTAELNDLEDVALGIATGTALVSSFKIDSGAPGDQDVTKADIDRVGKEAAEVRGLQAKKPITVTMITQDQLASEFKDEMEAETGTDDGQEEALYRLLGVLGPKDNLDSITGEVMNEQVAGYYNNETEDLRVVKGKTPSGFERLTVAHEYVHALQDQNFTAMDDEEADSDAALAVRALIEGDATLSAIQYADKKMAMADALQMFSDAQGEFDEDALEAAPDFLGDLFMFPYDQGMSFVSAAFDRGGWKAVDELYKRPPVSTEQVLHPERYRGDEKPVAVKLPKVADKLGAGWSLAEEEAIGEWAWRALLQPNIGPTFAQEAATGWGGDRYALVKDKNGAYALGIRTDWDTEEDRNQFGALLGMALRSRKGYQEQTDDLLAYNPVRLWQGPEDWWAIHSDGKTVLIGIGKTREVAEKLVAAVSE